ncbi:MAG: Lrp/AsnC family transcriptional regulator [Candidatus Thorarchaeota archaeon]|nr:Lrp/AsnC family transcriptional regulator [Candidatus Thorarchaeota archaeon]
MDDTDKKMMSILQANGRVSLSEIGKALGMSHVAVSKRLDKLISEDMVQVTAGVNAEKLDMKILFMGLEAESLEVADRIVEKYKSCPRLLTLATVTGRYNLFAVMVAEDTWTLESIIGTCSLRTEAGIRRSESWFGNAPLQPKFLQVSLAPHQTGGTAGPCKSDCADCKRYTSLRCVGCPCTTAYRGTVWATPEKQKGRGTRSKS